MLKNFRRKDLCRSLQLSQIITVQFSGKNKDTKLKCSGSVDPYRWITVYGYSDPDPALFFKDKKLLVRRPKLWKSTFFLIFCLLVEGSGARSVQIINVPGGPKITAPEHCKINIVISCRGQCLRKVAVGFG